MTSRGHRRHDDVIKSRACAMMSLRMDVITSQDIIFGQIKSWIAFAMAYLVSNKKLKLLHWSNSKFTSNLGIFKIVLIET